MKHTTGLGAGILVLLTMLSGLATPDHAAVRAIRHVPHSRSYVNSRNVPGGHYSAAHASSRYSSHGSHLGAKYGAHREPVQQSPMPDRIEEIQTALVQQGVYHGDPSGKWDGAMSDALRSFQERSGLTPTGKLDAASLQHLGLGSDVAGLNPPKAVLPSAPAATAKPALPPATRPTGY